MAKTKKKEKTGIENFLVPAIFIFSYVVALPESLSDDPLANFFLLSLPFFVALYFKPFRKAVIKFAIGTVKFIFNFVILVNLKGTVPVDIHEIDNMDGFEFEHYLKPVFERQGFRAEVTKGTGDFGADLILRKGGKKFVVQAKRYSNNIGVSAVQEVVAAVNFYKAHGAIVVTNQYFTPAAKELAKVNRVKLIDRDKLVGMIR